MEIHYIYLRKPILIHQGDGTFSYNSVSNFGGVTIGFTYREENPNNTKPVVRIDFAIADAFKYNFNRKEGRAIVNRKLEENVDAVEPVKGTGYIYCEVAKGDHSKKFAHYRQEVIDAFMRTNPYMKNSTIIREQGHNLIISKTKIHSIALTGAVYA